MPAKNTVIQGMKLILLKDYIEKNTNVSHTVRMSAIQNYFKENELGRPDRKTIYNYIFLLEENCGIKIQYDEHTKGYYLANPKFEPSELCLMIDSIQASKFITESEASSITEKIKGIADNYTRSNLNRMAIVRDRIRNNKESIIPIIDEIYYAINTDSKIQFQLIWYEGNLDKSKKALKKGEPYIVSPFAVYFENGNYYLHAYDEKRKFKNFRIDRISNVKTDIHARREGKEQYKESTLKAQRKYKVFNMFSKVGMDYVVSLRCHNRIANNIIDEFGKNLILMPADQNHFTCNVAVNASNTFYAWVATFGRSIKILGPQQVVDGMKEFLEKANSMYKDEE